MVTEGREPSEEVSAQATSVDAWTTALARATGSPGGGAATGVMLAIAASLSSMVAGYTHVGADLAAEREGVLNRSQSLREAAIRLADADSVKSKAFGAAYTLDAGTERDEAIRRASIDAARSSATLGDHAVCVVDDLEWLVLHGNKALVADLAVALSAARAALTGSRSNLSFDLAALTGLGMTLAEVREQYPALWMTVHRFDKAIERLDTFAHDIDGRAAPTD
jgi:formiminotetrahydrofolate cyclodeaminase